MPDLEPDYRRRLWPVLAGVLETGACSSSPGVMVCNS